MKKVYLIYAQIPALLFDSKINMFVSDSNKYKLSNNAYIGLYAWTTKKILLDAFIDFRKGAKNMYRVIKRKFNKNEFRIFRKENLHEELLYYRVPSKIGFDDNFSIGWEPTKSDTDNEKAEFFCTDDGATQIACTRHEFQETFEYGEQYLFEYMAQIVNADYLGFKDKYIQALDRLGYCDVFNSIYGDEDDSFYFDRYEATNYHKSYGLTCYGNQSIDIYENKIVLFINIFYEMLVGYDPNHGIKLLIYK